MSKNWDRKITVDDTVVHFGFIDEGGDRYGDRYFVTVNGKAVDVDIAKGLVWVLNAPKPTEEQD